MLDDIKGPRFTLAEAGLLWGIVTVFTGLIPGFVKDTTAVFLYAAAQADSRTVASLRYASVWDRFSLPKPAFGLQPSISLANIRALFRAS